MPRRPGVDIDGVPPHTWSGENNRKPYFFGEGEYQAYLHRLGKPLTKECCTLTC